MDSELQTPRPNASNAAATTGSAAPVSQSKSFLGVQDLVAEILNPAFGIMGAVERAIGPSLAMQEVMERAIRPSLAMQEVMERAIRPSLAMQEVVERAIRPSLAMQETMERAIRPVAMQETMERAIRPSLAMQETMERTIRPSLAMQEMMERAIRPSLAMQETIDRLLEPTGTLAEAQEFVKVLGSQADALIQLTQPSWTVDRIDGAGLGTYARVLKHTANALRTAWATLDGHHRLAGARSVVQELWTLTLVKTNAVRQVVRRRRQTTAPAPLYESPDSGTETVVVRRRARASRAAAKESHSFAFA